MSKINPSVDQYKWKGISFKDVHTFLNIIQHVKFLLMITDCENWHYLVVKHFSLCLRK